ncbi:virion structural protein [Bacillus phage vB_BpuM-BpSp]|nr:virion structural protein [Bacillus phage vB_BpuM-BpSp]
MASNSFTINQHIDITKEYDVFKKRNVQDHDVYIKGIPFIFITTPKLNLIDSNVNRDNFLIYMKNKEPEIFKSLTTLGSGISPFIKILTNSFKDMDGKDLAARTIDVNETFYGNKQTLPISIIDSLQGDTVTIAFEEYKHLPIVKLHKIWVEYTEHVRRGYFTASEDAITKRYLDFVSSIYYFELDMDGETILYYAKYTGAYPISVPYSQLVGNHSSHDIAELTVEYAYSYKEDLDPAILMDFNKVSSLDSEAMRYSEKQPNRGFIPYTTNDLLPANFTEQHVKNSKVLVLKSDPLDQSSIHPKTRFRLKFFK